MEGPTTSNVAWFLTIEERTKMNTVEKYKDVAPLFLSKGVNEVLDSLFCNEEVRLSIPRWAEGKESDAEPITHYILRHASSVSKDMLFIHPYDPILVRDHAKPNDILGAIYDDKYWPRDDGNISTFIIGELEKIAKDPEAYFSDVGERWGRCLVCSRTLKAEVSLERAIGPVCYKRVKRIGERIRRLSDREEEEEEEEEPKKVEIAEYRLYIPEGALFNDVEIPTVAKMNKALGSFMRAGLTLTTAMFPAGTEALTLEPQSGGKVQLEITASGKGMWVHVVEGRNARKILTSLGAEYNDKKNTWILPATRERSVRDRFEVIRVYKEGERMTREEAEKILTRAPSPTSISVPEPSPSLAPPPKSAKGKGVKTLDVKVEPYTYKSKEGVIVTGNTFTIRGRIKEIGGQWVKEEKGWFVPKEKEREIRDFIASLSTKE